MPRHEHQTALMSSNLQRWHNITFISAACAHYFPGQPAWSSIECSGWWHHPALMANADVSCLEAGLRTGFTTVAESAACQVSNLLPQCAGGYCNGHHLHIFWMDPCLGTCRDMSSSTGVMQSASAAGSCCRVGLKEEQTGAMLLAPATAFIHAQKFVENTAC